MGKKIAVISDIHSNNQALEAVLNDISIRGIDTIYNLGDSLYGPLDPRGTVENLMKYSMVHIMGNCDRLLFEQNESLNETVNFVKRNLTTEHLSWLKQHSNTVIVDDIFLCHGTPESDEIYLLEEMTKDGGKLKDLSEISESLKNVEQDVILCGHSHIPRIVYLPDGKLIVNPGSVGLPAYSDSLPIPHKMESGSPYAKYTVLEKKSTSWLFEQINVPYDWEKASEIALKNARPDWAKSLNSGWS